jgi:hypothetical protein
MVDRFRDRIKILEDQEIDELYGPPGPEQALDSMAWTSGTSFP